MPLCRVVGVIAGATLFLAPFTARGQFVQQGQEIAGASFECLSSSVAVSSDGTTAIAGR